MLIRGTFGKTAGMPKLLAGVRGTVQGLVGVSVHAICTSIGTRAAPRYETAPPDEGLPR